MSNYIKKTKEDAEYNPIVYAPIRAVSEGMKTEEYARAPIMNVVSAFESSSILSMLDSRSKQFSDISGMAVTMSCHVQDKYTEDEVTVVGERGNFYIVEIDGVKYSVNKGCATFIKRV